MHRVLGFILALGCASCANTVHPDFRFQYSANLPDDVQWLEVVAAYNYLGEISPLLSEYIGVAIPVVIHASHDLEGRVHWEDEAVHVKLPVLMGKVASYHLLQATHVMSHEATEFALAAPECLGGTLYGACLRTRWIGDGLAEVVAKRARGALCEHLKMTDLFEQKLQMAGKLVSEEIDLSVWTMRTEGPHIESVNQVANYLAARKTADMWIAQAKSQGIENPIREILGWLRANPNPSYDQITSWMSDVSGLQIGEKAKRVLL